MPLTSEDVSRKKFTAVRLREGYDTAEVDAFLEEVEAELVRLTQENAELHIKLQTAQTGTAAVPSAETGSEPSVAAAEPATSAPPIETIRVSTTPEASAAAARLLEIATRSADELLGDARAEADGILSTARSEAARVEQDARTRAQQLDAATGQRRTELFSALEQEQAVLTGEVERLRTFEREYRAELKDYFAKQLHALEHPLAHSERFGTTPTDATGQPTSQPASQPTS